MSKYTVEMTTTVYVMVEVEADDAAEAKDLALGVEPQACGSSLDMDFMDGRVTVESCDTRDTGFRVHSVEKEE